MQAKSSGGEVTIAVFCGGGAQAAAADLDMIAADLGVSFDVPSELGDGMVLDERIIPVPLAEGESIGSLLAKFSTDPRFTRACEILATRPGDLTQGLAQTPVLGAMAYHDLPDLARVWDQVLNRVRFLTNGAPERIRLVVLGSNSGGTGRGVMLLATQSLVSALHDSTDAVVNVQHLRIGAQTFNGLGAHIRGNNAVGTIEDLARVMGTDHGLREVRSFTGLELPMVEEDKSLRDKFVRLVLQALLSPSAQLAIGRRDVNLAVTAGPYGRLSTVQAGIWSLSDQINLAASAAVVILPEVRSLMEEPVLKIAAPKMKVTTDSSVTKTADHQGLVSIAIRGGHLPADVWDRYIVSHYQVQGAIFVKTGEQDLPLTNTLASGLPKSVESYRQRRALLHALRSAAQAKLESVRGEEARVQLQMGVARNTLDKALGVLFPRTLIQKILALFSMLFSSRGKQVALLKASLEVYARLERRLAGLQAERQAYEDAVTRVNRAIELYESYLRQAHEWLMEETGNEGAITGLFTFRGLADVFSNLLVARFSNDKKRFKSAVAKAISGVTRDGLARMLGADDTSSLSLARVMMGNPPVITPPWGGKRQRAKPRSFLVIPPVTEELSIQLQQALQDLGATCQLLQTETVVGGVAVVALDLQLVDGVDDVLTTQYRVDLKRAQASTLDVLARVPGNPSEAELQAVVEKLEGQEGEQ
ncbi:MAG TPA: hypothetical protein DHT43_05800 [Deltaproteobacteria bacterium]|nr:hypothetical protein [Deltaproteobacteria bacterium]